MATHTAVPLVRSASGAAFWRPILVAGLGSFVIALGFSAVGLALPRIAEDFGEDVTAVQWIPLIQSLMMTGFLLPGGWLGDRFGLSRVYAAGLVLFVAGGIASAIAPSLLALVGARIVVTFGTAMTTALTPAITVGLVAPDRRGQALGWTTTFTYVGLAIGPTLGGLAMGLWDWRGALFLAVPPAALLFLAALRWLPAAQPHRPEGKTAFDALGTGLLVLGFGAGLLALTRGAAWGWLSPAVLGLAAFSAGALVAFWRWERRVAAPLLDFRLFESRFFTFASLSSVFMFLGAWTPPFLMPFYLIDARGIPASEAGLLMVTFPIATMFAAPFAGVYSDRIGPGRLATAGILLVAVSLAMLATLGPDSTYFDIMIRIALTGVGSGLFNSPNNSALLGSVKPGQRGTVSAFTGTVRNIGIATGVAIAGTVYGETIRSAGEGGHYLAIQAAFSVVAAITILGIVTSVLAYAPRRPQT